MTELSLVVPVLNEEDALPIFVARVVPILESITSAWEIVFVNDGSTDGTLRTLRELHRADVRFKAIDLSRNFGKELALTAGIDATVGRAVVPMDVDLQDPPELIVEMVAKWREGFDVVLALRSDRASDTWLKRSTAGAFYAVLNHLSSVDIPANVGDFRLLDRRAVNALGGFRERERFMKGLFASLGFTHAVVPYVRPARSAGETKFRAWKLWLLAVEGIISFSTKPLKIWTYIGIICAAAAAAHASFLIVRVIFFGIDVPGYASLMSAILFLNGLILTGLGVIGEYIARIFYEVKARPLYLVREWIGADRTAPPPSLLITPRPTEVEAPRA